jgi:pantoate--beta-alanine ligase
MNVFTEIREIRQFSQQAKVQRKSIGFVPTMGALHAGHLHLIQKSKAENDITICSIFVNPTQFNNPEDLQKYPRDLKADLALLEEAECDGVFHPSPETMYPNAPISSISFGYLEDIMEGKFRPGHFRGVGLIVGKLFNIILPTRAYFGQKDLQQLTLIRTMISEWNFDVQIVPVNTVREPDGLAMSSRNKLLSPAQRAAAADLYQVLLKAKNKLIAGESVNAVREFVHDLFEVHDNINLEYFEIVRSRDLRNIVAIETAEAVSLCVAGYLGKVRLIDNISLN